MLNGTSTDVRAAYQHCERITRQQAKNFAYGIALLPGDKRRALSAVYAFARRIDDIGDGTLPAADKLAALEQARAVVTSIAVGQADSGANGSDPVLRALRDAVRRFPIPVSAFGELIDGCEADVRGTSYATFAELEHYCRCVAGSIGRLSLGVFGSADIATAAPLADALGVALQLTNILRDISEDLACGRVYLPAEDLRRFGCTLEAGEERDGAQAAALSLSDIDDILIGRLTELIRFEGQRARGWYATGMRLMPLLDWRSAASAGAMAGIYLRLLEHICAAPQAALARRMSLPTGEKARVAVSALAGLTRRPRPPEAGNPAGAPSRAPSGPGDPR